MMKFTFMMLMMIPLSLFSNYFWINQLMFLMLTFFFLFFFSPDNIFLYISGVFGWDLLSYNFILLSMWICSLMVLASYKIYKEKFYSSMFCFSVLLLLMSLYFLFSSLNLFIFYLFFEISLIPTLILILGWGYQPERLQAGVYLLFYTLFASLPMLISIFYLDNIYCSLVFSFFDFSLNSFLLFICVNMVFLIKMPMYFIHLWLPKAHVEAPVSGSMILAGIMLKLGGYGMLRLMKLFIGISSIMSYLFIGISIFGGVVISLLCLRQTDVKSLIAYSSVAHMGLVLGGIMTFSYWGFCGSLMMMIAHGLSSSALFCLANITYERVGSRSLFLNKGMMNLMPKMSLWWFLFSACNMAAPPSLNLSGEIMLMNSLISWSIFNMFGLALISFFSACYSLYLFSCSQHGKFFSGLFNFNFSKYREYLLMLLHWVPLNLLILKGELFSLFI
uniref:NADH-ubiquinone oxidoreductase chain 4 n=1 Tax=Agrilus discalis TaxID=3013958 RepID=A0A9E9FU96_9COLE|nr:NADH dehydrogenase subunit 4 [Agrilus discalis]WAP90839.1 NADH dehydrogenase subunit 4 [Agrilus discalis]